MTSTPQSPPRLRLGRRDLIPILATGLILAGGYIIANRGLTSRGVGAALLGSIGLMFALAGMQGPAAHLTVREAVKGWLRLVIVAFVALLAGGRFSDPNLPLRSAVFVAATLAASLLLFALRTRRR